VTRKLSPILAALLLTSACADPQAAEKCYALVEAVCVNVSEACFPPMDVDICLDQMDVGLGCEDAFDVSDSYDECLDELATSDECLPNTGMPEPCEGAILVLE